MGADAIMGMMGDSVGESEPLPVATDADADIVAETDSIISEPITQESLDKNKGAETSPEDEVADLKEKESDSEDKDAEQKVVPLDALHEEREKRKQQRKVSEDLEARNTELTEQLHQAIQDVKKLAETESTEFQSSEEKVLNKIKSDMEDLKMDRNEREEKEKSAAIKSASDQLKTDIADTSKKLEDAGFPGFDFLAHKVGDEINRLIREDPDNAYLDNQEGWMQIYKKIIFPPVKKAFAVEEKNELFDKKKEAKKGSSLITSPGSPGKKPDSEKSEDWSPTDYAEWRKGNSINS